MTSTTDAEVKIVSPPTARSRNQTPPPKPKQHAEKSDSAGDLVSEKAADTKPKEAATVQEPTKEASTKAEPTEENLPKASSSWPAILLLTVAVAVLAITLTQFQAIATWWASVSAPLNTWFIEHADLMVALAALPFFLPFVLLFLVTAARAALDLRHFNLWQKVLLGLLVGTALATFFIDESARKYLIGLPNKAATTWKTVSKPLEQRLVDNTDYVVAGCAMITGIPLILFVLRIVTMALWGLRFKVVTAETQA
jgi:hypothetical protein